jgi:hypothetical protein
VLSEDLAAIERKKLNGKVKKRNKQVVARPSQREAKPDTPIKEAYSAVKKIVRDRNININR